MPLAARSLLLDIAAAGARAVAVGERGHVLLSDDQGQTWRQGLVPTTQMLTAVCFVDERRGWAVGHDGLILVTDNGGENWLVQRDGLAEQARQNLLDRELASREVKRLQNAVADAAPDQHATLELQLEDALLDLEDAELALDEAVFTSPLLDVWFQDSLRGWATGAFGALLVTDDGGGSWNQVDELIDNPDQYHLNAITGDGRGRVFIAGESGTMFRSLDGGASWHSLRSPYRGSWFGATYNASSNTLLVYGLQGQLYRSLDFGDSWQAVENPGTATLAGGTANGDEVLLVGANGTVLYSDDNGQTFRRTQLADGKGLTAALGKAGKYVLTGQGGPRHWAPGGNHE